MYCSSFAIQSADRIGNAEVTRLEDICESIKDVYEPSGAYLLVKLDLGAVQEQQLEVAESGRQAERSC